MSVGATAVPSALPHIKGRMVWQCSACGHMNDDQLGFRSWKVDCAHCGESVVVTHSRVPRGGTNGWSREHYALWLSRRQQLGQ